MISRKTWLLLCLILSLFAVVRYLAPQVGTGREGDGEPSPEGIARRQAALDGQGAAPITPEAVAEEQMIEQGQVETATAWLQDPNPEQRVFGAEQLSAYPTREAESHLIAALRSDLSPDVRVAAARALDYYESWEEWTMPTLLDALEDADDDVRFSAFGSLQGHYYRLDGDSPEAGSLLESLRERARSPRTPPDTRQMIREFLDDESG